MIFTPCIVLMLYSDQHLRPTETFSAALTLLNLSTYIRMGTKDLHRTNKVKQKRPFRAMFEIQGDSSQTFEIVLTKIGACPSMFQFRQP